MSFSGLIGALEAGRIDTIANQITITPEREEAFVFGDPYVIDGAQIVTREGSEATISGPKDLSGKFVAVNLGSNFEDLLREVLDLMRRVAESRQTMLIVAHEMQFTREIAHRVIFMDGGRIVEHGPPGAIFGVPQDPRIRDFLRRVA